MHPAKASPMSSRGGAADHAGSYPASGRSSSGRGGPGQLSGQPAGSHVASWATIFEGVLEASLE